VFFNYFRFRPARHRRFRRNEIEQSIIATSKGRIDRNLFLNQQAFVARKNISVLFKMQVRNFS